MKFEALNINCQNCANTIKNALEAEFGKIEVDLTKEPKVVEVASLDPQKVSSFKEAMNELGFEVL